MFNQSSPVITSSTMIKKMSTTMSAYGQQINAGEELPVGLLVYDN